MSQPRAVSQPRAGSHRDRILAAALEVTGTEGWGAVTMARLAGMAGVSRQTVYNEVGAKPQLAHALVADQLRTFLDAVDRAFSSNAGSPTAGVRDAVHIALELAEKDPLIRAVVSGAGGAAQDLAPLLTTRSEAILSAAHATVLTGLRRAGADLPDQDLDGLADAVVRVTISHMMQPVGSPEATAASLASITAAVLDRPRRG